MPTHLLSAFHDLEPAEDSLLDAVTEGLSKPRKTLPCKFFYDRQGSKLFEEICGLEEYYPTRTEMALLEAHGAEMGRLMGPECNLVEFGSGASRKVRTLLAHMDQPRTYVSIDISRNHLIESSAILARDFPELEVIAICADYTQPFDIPELENGKRVGFFPGSTIGNFVPDEAATFLTLLAGELAGGALLIGVDLKKDEQLLHAAYNDSKGVTADFNKNLLRRINRELGATFDLAAFDHDASWNGDVGRIEMHLVSRRDQTVRAGDQEFDFKAGERIHTENSYKYSLGEFRDVAMQAGFEPVQVWTDPGQLFSVHYLAAP